MEESLRILQRDDIRGREFDTFSITRHKWPPPNPMIPNSDPDPDFPNPLNRREEEEDKKGFVIAAILKLKMFSDDWIKRLGKLTNQQTGPLANELFRGFTRRQKKKLFAGF